LKEIKKVYNLFWYKTNKKVFNTQKPPALLAVFMPNM